MARPLRVEISLNSRLLSPNEKTSAVGERYASPVAKSHARILVSVISSSRVPIAFSRSRWRHVKGRAMWFGT